jgi:hypothetical protein
MAKLGISEMNKVLSRLPVVYTEAADVWLSTGGNICPVLLQLEEEEAVPLIRRCSGGGQLGSGGLFIGGALVGCFFSNT